MNIMEEVERQALLTGETRAEWLSMLTARQIGLTHEEGDDE